MAGRWDNSVQVGCYKPQTSNCNSRLQTDENPLLQLHGGGGRDLLRGLKGLHEVEGNLVCYSGMFANYNWNCYYQIRTLIKQIKEYGVNEDDLFHEDDLIERANIPRVCKCLKEIAIIVSII